jgi:hypothetical protein
MPHLSPEHMPQRLRWLVTADLPIFRSLDNSSPSTACVRNLHGRIDANTDELGRT